MRISTIDLHRDLAAFVLDQFKANPAADKQAVTLVRQAVEQANRAADLARTLRKTQGEEYKNDPDMLVCMRDFRDAFKAAQMPLGGKQDVLAYANTLVSHLGLEGDQLPGFLQPKPEQPAKPARTEQATVTPAKAPKQAKQPKPAPASKQASAPAKGEALVKVARSARSTRSRKQPTNFEQAYEETRERDLVSSERAVTDKSAEQQHGAEADAPIPAATARARKSLAATA